MTGESGIARTYWSTTVFGPCPGAGELVALELQLNSEVETGIRCRVRLIAVLVKVPMGIAMSVSIWVYLHLGEGCWRRMSLAWLDRFYRGRDRVPNPLSAEAELAEIAIAREGRILVEVHRTLFMKVPVQPSGFIDEPREREREQTLMEAAAPELPLTPAHEKGALIESSRLRFAKRRADYLSKWQPSQHDLQALRKDLTRRGVPD